jgi:hypothetical protein
VVRSKRIWLLCLSLEDDSKRAAAYSAAPEWGIEGGIGGAPVAAGTQATLWPGALWRLSGTDEAEDHSKRRAI